MQPFQKEHRNQSCPNLDVNGIGTGSDEAFDFQVLFERFEKHFDLPAVLVDVGNRGRAKLQMIREKDQRFFTFDIDNDAAKLQITTVATPPLAIESDDLVFKNIAMRWNGTGLIDRPIQIVT